ncbi:hypothetical protein RCO48_20390 [Peribacillus frigoritolerans]|nr:hypothetical protein [Peribacillus frigoritolerans]
MKKILLTILTASVFILGVCMPTKGEAAALDRTLSFGMSNSDVKELQELLLTKGGFSPIMKQQVTTDRLQRNP